MRQHLGVLGAVVGLIAALGEMNDTDTLGQAISAAFIATLYLVFLQVTSFGILSRIN